MAFSITCRVRPDELGAFHVRVTYPSHESVHGECGRKLALAARFVGERKARDLLGLRHGDLAIAGFADDMSAYMSLAATLIKLDLGKGWCAK